MINKSSKIEPFMQEIRWIIPRGIAHKSLYYKKMQKKLNLKNPKDLNEKIHYLMVYEHGDRETEYADKVLVREYVKKLIGETILTQIYGIYKNVDEINFDNLPEKFVIKTNHDCRSSYICLDKNKFNFEKCKKDLSTSLKRNFAKKKLEYHYSNIKPLILCEEYIDDGSGVNPKDYKFFCFNGQVECILVCSEREKEVKQNWYNIEWKSLNYAIEEFLNSDIYEKPKNFDKMIEIAQELSKEFKFVRVDLYNANGKIYFGELTFTPSAGFIKTNTQESLDYLGSLIKL